jgi:hypothetical protein
MKKRKRQSNEEQGGRTETMRKKIITDALERNEKKKN